MLSYYRQAVGLCKRRCSHEGRKKAEDRKNEILDAVDELFGQKGFDGTSTNDILEKVGIARGTLYHHFKSKEDIMDALIDRYAVRLIDGAQEVAADKSIPIVERIIRVVMALNLSGEAASKLWSIFINPRTH